MIVTEQLQKDVILEFLSPLTDVQMDEALYAMRTAHLAYDDPEFREISLWVKYNIARFGNLTCGDIAPDVSLVSFKRRNEMTIHNLFRGNIPLVLIAGSYT